MPDLVPGTKLDLGPGDWSDRDNCVGRSPIVGTVLKTFVAPWPLVQLQHDDGTREWIHVRLGALSREDDR